MQNQMELKFLELKQGNMTVLEYEKKFTELSRFVTKYTSTEEEKQRNFSKDWSLGSEIGWLCLSLKPMRE